MINTLGHVKDIDAKIYMPPITRLDTTNFIVFQTSLMQELLGDGYVLKDHENKFANANVQGSQQNFITWMISHSSIKAIHVPILWNLQTFH